MNSLNSLKSVLAAAIVTTGLFGFGTSSADAGFDHGYQPSLIRPIVSDCHEPIRIPRCTYKTVIDFEFRTETYVDYITKYAPCGRPYTVKVLRTRTIKVPVERLVKVCY
ncbi:MAG: hypothetical protein R3B90_05385 [Planctomycetaceae bacterium]